MEMWHTGTWAVWRPPATGRRVLRTMFYQNTYTNMKHCAPAQNFLFWSGHLGSGEMVSESNFMISWKCPGAIQMHQECSLVIPNVLSDTWNALVFILQCLKNHHPSYRNPRSLFSQGWFCDLEETNDTHELPTHCSSFPRWHFYSWRYFKMW